LADAASPVSFLVMPYSPMSDFLAYLRA